jgi:hypothetical protein
MIFPACNTKKYTLCCLFLKSLLVKNVEETKSFGPFEPYAMAFEGF